MAGGFRSKLDARLDQSLDELVKEDTAEKEKRKSSRYSPYPHSESQGGKSRARGGGGNTNTVYVGNLIYSITEDELRHHMSKVGMVVGVNLFEKPGGTPKGCGLVEYHDKDVARLAIETLNGSELLGRKIIVREDLNPGDRDNPGLKGASNYKPIDSKKIPFNISVVPSCTVFVENLDYSVDWIKLKDTFKVAGQVVHAEINKSRDGKSKGNGTVQFKTPIEAINAVSLFHGQMLFNRPMVVRMDRDAPTQVDSSLLKLSMRLDSLVKTGAVQLDPGVLPMEEPLPAAYGGSLAPLGSSHPSAGSSSSALLREQQFQEELAELQRRQRVRDAMEVEILIRRHFGGGDRSMLELDAGVGMHGSDVHDKERYGGLGGIGQYYDSAVDIGRSSLDMPSSERYASRGRLSPNPLGGMHSSLVRDELLPPTREDFGLLSGGHFDVPSLGGMRGGALGSLSVGDREPSLLDQVMAERQRGAWRLDDDPLMSRRHDEIPRRSDEIFRRSDEIPRRSDEILRRSDEIPRRSDEILRRSDEIPRRSDEIPRQLNEMSRHHDDETTESGGRRVFLRNLPWSTTSRHLKNFFNRMIGPVTYAEVMMLPSGRSKGIGVVEFASSNLAKKAITEFHRKTLGGRVIEITEDKFEHK